MVVEKMNIREVKENPENPREIKKDRYKKLLKSIKELPEMLEVRPIMIDDDNVVIGGNMRLKACTEIGLKEVPVIRFTREMFEKSTAARNGKTYEEAVREIIIKDNVNYGDWDFDELANAWDVDELDAWGLEVPEMTETARLSGLEFNDIYYTPQEKPNINLANCLDLDKFNAKLQVINESDLTDEQKEVLKMFAYRFIKIDFESVANYYFFNASEEEKKVIERLRLVLCDSGLKGFIEDDILLAHQVIDDWGDE